MTDIQRDFDGDDLDPRRLKLARDLGLRYDSITDDVEGAIEHLAYNDIHPGDDGFQHAYDITMAFLPLTDDADDFPPLKAIEQFVPFSDILWTATEQPRLADTGDDRYWFGLVRDGSRDRPMWVDDRGFTYYEETIEYIAHGAGGLYQQLDPDGPQWLYRESWDEYANTLVAVEPDGTRYKCLFSDGVMMDFAEYDREYDYIDGSSLQDPIHDIVLGTGWVSTDAWRGYNRTPSEAGPEGVGTRFVQAKSGWHSTMEGSDQQELINDITSGRQPVNAPVLVVFKRTSNVFSVGLSLYIPEEYTDDLDRLFYDTGAAPGYAGVR